MLGITGRVGITNPFEPPEDDAVLLGLPPEPPPLIPAEATFAKNGYMISMVRMDISSNMEICFFVFINITFLYVAKSLYFKYRI